MVKLKPLHFKGDKEKTMLYNSIKPLLVLTLIFALLACKKARDNETIMPLAIGNYWTYEMENYPDGFPDPVPITEHTQKIESEIIWGGHTWYGNKRDSADEYHRNAEEGIYILQIDDEHPDGIAKLLFEYPIKVGTSWTVRSGSVITTTVVEAIDETVTVPAGVFYDCLRCEAIMPDIPDMVMPGRMTFWIKPGVGTVQMEITGDNWRAFSILKKYHLE